MQRQQLQKLSREELVREAERAGVPRPRLLTQAELIDEILKRTATSDRDRARARGWLGRARDLLATVVEKGLHLPDAAAAIRQGQKGWPPPPPPLPTVTLAEIYAAQGHLERAVAVLDEVLRREPDHDEARELRERFLEQLGRSPDREAGPGAPEGSAPEEITSTSPAGVGAAAPASAATSDEPTETGRPGDEAAPPAPAVLSGAPITPTSAPPTMPAAETRERGASMEGDGAPAAIAASEERDEEQSAGSDQPSPPTSVATTSRSPSATPPGSSSEIVAGVVIIAPPGAEARAPMAPLPFSPDERAPDSALADTAPAEPPAAPAAGAAIEAASAAEESPSRPAGGQAAEAAPTSEPVAEAAPASEPIAEAAPASAQVVPAVEEREAAPSAGAAAEEPEPAVAATAGEVATSEAAALPARYDVDEVVAIAVDPSTFYVYWEVRPATFAHAAAQAPGGWLALRVTAVTPGWDGPIVETRDIRIDALYGDRFVHHVRPRADVRVSVGWLADGRFDPIAVGSEVSAPRAFVAAGAPAPAGAPLDLSEGPHGAPHGTAFSSHPDEAASTIFGRPLAITFGPYPGAGAGAGTDRGHGGRGAAAGVIASPGGEHGPATAFGSGPDGEPGAEHAQPVFQDGSWWSAWTDGGGEGAGEGTWWRSWTEGPGGSADGERWITWTDGQAHFTEEGGSWWESWASGWAGVEEWSQAGELTWWRSDSGTWGGASEGGRWGGASGVRWGGASERRVRWGGASGVRWGGASGVRWGGASERRVRWGGASERPRWGGASERGVQWGGASERARWGGASERAR